MAEKKIFRKEREQEGKAEGEIRFTEGIPAEVKEILSRAENRGDITQISCQVLEGRDKNRTLRRNVRGPVRIGDILMLLETEIEAQRLGRSKWGGGKKKEGGRK